jgi:hypothetical protein
MELHLYGYYAAGYDAIAVSQTIAYYKKWDGEFDFDTLTIRHTQLSFNRDET